MTITTASSGEDPANPEMQLYTMAKKIEAGEVNDPSFYYRIYEADKDCNVEDEAQWYKSNPALGVFRKLEDLANYAKRIRLMPLQENMFRRMFLNQHVALDHEKGAINMDLWDTCTKKGRYRRLKRLEVLGRAGFIQQERYYGLCPGILRRNYGALYSRSVSVYTERNRSIQTA